MIVVCTSNGGYWDYLRPQPCNGKSQYICFSDSFQPEVMPWRIQPLPWVFEEGAFNARVPKICPHLFFDQEFVIWQDGSHVLRKDPSAVIGLLGSADLALMRHPIRTCVYKEAELCLREKIGDAGEIRRMVEAYLAEGIPENIGLWGGGQIIRRNNALKEFNEAWWREFLRFRTGRDQFSLAYTIYKMQPKISVIPGHHLDNDYWDYKYHSAWNHRSGNAELAPKYERYKKAYRRLEELCSGRRVI